MATPRQRFNPDTIGADKAISLRRAATAARKREKAEADELLAMRVASHAGASLREIAEATSRNHATVGRLIARPEREAPRRLG